jgi:FixJ family two-component response regulator
VTAVAERVFIVDDEPALRSSLALLLRSAGLVAEAFGSPEEFLARFDPELPGCLVLDVSMPGLDGLELQQVLADRGSQLPIIFLTGQGDIPKSVRAMKQGAADFLTKPVDGDRLLESVRQAMETDRAGRLARLELVEIRRRLSTLTPREREVLEGMIAGMLNKQIGAYLGAAEATVKIHRARVMAKMGAGSMAELARMADQAGVRRSEREPRA